MWHVFLISESVLHVFFSSFKLSLCSDSSSESEKENSPGNFLTLKVQGIV